MQSVGRGSGATVSLCQSRPFVNFQHPQVPGGCLEQMPIRVHTDVHIFGICALIAEANLLVATSLHCRIVALNYHVPRVTFASKPTLTKHAHFGYLWDGDIHKQAWRVTARVRRRPLRASHEPMKESATPWFRCRACTARSASRSRRGVTPTGKH